MRICIAFKGALVRLPPLKSIKTFLSFPTKILSLSFLHLCYICSLSYSSHNAIIISGEEAMKLFIMQLSPSFCSFLPSRSGYTLQHAMTYMSSIFILNFTVLQQIPQSKHLKGSGCRYVVITHTKYLNIDCVIFEDISPSAYIFGVLY
jgi:hypothetical protein